MTIERKLIKTSGATAEAVYVEEVFQTHLYTGTGAAQTITNGIDLATKGGLVWLKGRSGATDHALYDTARGATYDIGSNLTSAQTTQSTGLTAFGTTGFTLGALAKLNTSAATYTSWTFRKQPKFFDIVTYTGDGSSPKTIAHSLGSVPGMIIVKGTSAATNWPVYHRTLANTQCLRMDLTDASTTISNFGDTTPTSTQFYVGSNNNANGLTYVAYLFAHNAGGFGAAGTDSVVSCGSYTGNGSTSGPTVNLGWEPQFVILKRADFATAWMMVDNMRGATADGINANLYPHLSNSEVPGSTGIAFLSNGFQPRTSDSDYNVSGNTYIYLAIRRGPMKTPTDATKVFAPVAYTGSATPAVITTNVQTAGGGSVWIKRRNLDQFSGGRNWAQYDNLRGVGRALMSDMTNAEYSDNGLGITSFNMSGFSLGGGGYQYNDSTGTFISYTFQRAPGFFDVVCYTGTGDNRTVTHNLGVAPELIIVKTRNTADNNWKTLVVSAPGTLNLNSSGAINTTDNQYYYGNGSTYVAPTSTVFSVYNNVNVNASGQTYVAYLFASCPGVSKVGSYTGSGTTKQIDCGFAAGARFVLIKRTDSTGDWFTWDSSRGIVSGNDPYLLLNSTAAEVTNTDYIDPYSAGFEISSSAPAAINASGGTFIFLAVA
jgi:hypothetical protein